MFRTEVYNLFMRESFNASGNISNFFSVAKVVLSMISIISYLALSEPSVMFVCSSDYFDSLGFIYSTFLPVSIFIEGILKLLLTEPAQLSEFMTYSSFLAQEL